MPQSFRHVLRGFEASEVEAFVAAHRKRWWQGRHLAIKAKGDRLKAARPASKFSQPPVLKATVRPGGSGAVVEGRLHRGVSLFINLCILGAAAIAAVLGSAGVSNDSTALAVLGFVFAGLFVLVYLGLVVVGRLARDAEAAELKGDLDRFFGLRE